MHEIFVILLFAAGAVIFGGAGFILQSAFKNSKKHFLKFIPLAVLSAILVYMLVKPMFFFYYVAVGFIMIGAAISLVLNLIKSKKGE